MKKQLLLLFSTICLNSYSQIYITEIMNNPPESGTDSLEYIEIYNNGPTPVDLLNHKLSITSIVRYQFTVSTVLNANDFIVFALNGGAVKRNFNLTFDPIQWTSAGLSNAGTTISILDENDVVLSSVSYLNSWVTGTNAGGKSMQFCPSFLDNTISTNWFASTIASGNFINTFELFGSPGSLEVCNCVTPTISSTVSDSLCDAGIVSISVNPSAGIIKWFDDLIAGNEITDGGAYTIDGNELTINNLATTTTYYAEAVDGFCVSASRTPVIVTIGNCTKLRPEFCDITLSNLNDQVLCETVPSATNYRYEITDGVSTWNYTKGSNAVGFRLTLVNGTSLGITYSVKVASMVGGSWSAYGNACTLTTPSTVIKSQFRNSTLSNLDDPIACETVIDATNYKYELFDGVTTLTFEKGSSGTNFKLSQVANIKYGTTYAIRCASFKNGVWSDFGTAYNVNTPATKVQDKFCNETVNSLNDFLSYYPVPNATNYKLEAFDGTSTLEYTKNGIGLTFRMSQFPNVQANTSYQVKVAAYVDGAWQSFGDACTITTPTLRVGNLEINENIDNVEVQDIELLIFPNPNNGEFTINSPIEDKFEIVNELGQVVQTVAISKDANYEVKISGLKAGVYFVKGNGVVQKIIVN